MIPAELDTGPSPPGPEMRRPGDKTWPTRECRFSEPTIDSYISGSQTSSDLLRLACAEELAARPTCSRDISPGRKATCR
jgi:hypothetical protein